MKDDPPAPPLGHAVGFQRRISPLASSMSNTRIIAGVTNRCGRDPNCSTSQLAETNRPIVRQIEHIGAYPRFVLHGSHTEMS